MKGFVKNFTNLFKRYKSPILPLKLRFELPDQITDTRQRLFYKSIQNRNVKGFFLFMFSVGLAPLNYTKEELIQFIAGFTLDSYKDEEIDYLKHKILAYHKKQVSSIEYEDRKKVEIVFKGKKMCIRRMSEVFPEIAKKEPDILTKERFGRCHWKSISLSQNFQLYEDYKVSVVTGSTTHFAVNAKILHSWIEIEKEGKETLVCDYTGNLLTNKDSYYELYSVKPIEKIYAEQIEEDMKLFNKLEENSKSLVNKDNFIKLYLSSREECMKKLKKEILNIEDETEKQNCQISSFV